MGFETCHKINFLSFVTHGEINQDLSHNKQTIIFYQEK